MHTTKKVYEEDLEFEKIAGRPLEKFKDHFRIYPKNGAYTKFGINGIAVEEFGKRLHEFKHSDEMIIVNDVGLGIEERKGIVFRGVELTKRNVSFEPFELLNQIKLAGIDRFKLYGIDKRRDALLAVKSTKILKVWEEEKGGEYFQNFFRGFHKGDGSVEIPKEYRKKVVCLKLDIEKTPAPEKAHITFSFMYLGAPMSENCLENLVKSTRKGGYLMTYGPQYLDVMGSLGLEEIGPIGGSLMEKSDIRIIELPSGSRLGSGNLYPTVYRLK